MILTGWVVIGVGTVWAMSVQYWPDVMLFGGIAVAYGLITKDYHAD